MTVISGRQASIIALATCAVLAASVRGQSTLDHPVGVIQPLVIDTGVHDNATDQTRLVFSVPVNVADAGWIRLYFDVVTLPPGSYAVLTSAQDGAAQTLTAAGMAAWYDTSAYFNGDTIQLDLYAGPHTAGTRLRLAEVAVEFRRPAGNVAGLDCGICNGEDDRTASDQRYTGRMMPVGCTGSMYNDEGCFVSAGHCTGALSVVEFQVPPSLEDGTLQHPGPQDQYPVITESIASVNGGVGNDWAHFSCGPNTETGLLAIEAQDDFRPIAVSLPDTFPATVEIYGYGVHEVGELNQAQKYSVGNLLTLSSHGAYFAWDYDADVTGGNSGSAMMHNGEIIGIVTHCSLGCPNFGTTIDHPVFTDARLACPPRTHGDCDRDVDVDLLDAALLPGCLTGPFGLGTFECNCMDLDGDDDVDVKDYATLEVLFTGEQCVPPQVTTDPVGQAVCAGDRIVLTASYTGSGPQTYQWFRDGEALVDATDQSLAIEDFDEADVGSYTVEVTNTCATATSTPAALALCAAELLNDTFEGDQGWTVVSDPAMVRGQWLRAVPQQAKLEATITQPGYDSDDAGDFCFATGPYGGAAVSNDVDGGPTELFSPIFDTTDHAALTLRYAYWFFRDNEDGDDALVVSISDDGGYTWIELTRHDVCTAAWQYAFFPLDLYAPLTDGMRLRFSVEDRGGETALEGLIDDVHVTAGE